MSKIQTEEKVQGLLENAEITNSQRADIFDMFFVANPIQLAKYLYSAEVPLQLASELLREKISMPPKAWDTRSQLEMAVDALLMLSKIDPKILAVLENTDALSKAIASGQPTDRQRVIETLVRLAETDPGIAEIATRNPTAAKELIASARSQA